MPQSDVKLEAVLMQNTVSVNISKKRWNTCMLQELRIYDILIKKGNKE